MAKKEIKIAIARGICCPMIKRLLILFVKGRRAAAMTSENTKYRLILEKYHPNTKTRRVATIAVNITFSMVQK
tara:strand:- start:12471 stop:12689 length:219 start_codon:yes stop_codon:yes gene_type:complete